MGVLLMGCSKDQLSDAQRQAVEAEALGFEVVYSCDRSEIERRLAEIEVVARRFPRDLVARAKNLKWFQQWSAGADWLLAYPELADKDFILTSVSGIHAVPISEQIFAYLLALARGLPQAVRNQQTRTWPRGDTATFELAGKTMLLLGVGAIGLETARLAKAFGMKVTGVRRNAKRPAGPLDEVITLADLDGALPHAEVVVLTLPLTRDTRHLFDEDAFLAIKDGAIFVNIGRGGLVSEPALVKALASGKLSGAGLDVFEEEPLPESSPLWAMDNVIITPHMAGATPHYDRRALEIFLENLRRYRAGEALTHVVDKARGY